MIWLREVYVVLMGLFVMARSVRRRETSVSVAEMK